MIQLPSTALIHEFCPTQWLLEGRCSTTACTVRNRQTRSNIRCQRLLVSSRTRHCLTTTSAKSCNEKRLGVLDEQLARAGVEGFLRKFYGIKGHSEHDPVNPFYRGSAGGHRLEMKSFDQNLGMDVLLEVENGVPRQCAKSSSSKTANHVIFPSAKAPHLSNCVPRMPNAASRSQRMFGSFAMRKR
jgi:hypothetical protein